jgi:uncharacterized membrane-anchored protein
VRVAAALVACVLLGACAAGPAPRSPANELEAAIEAAHAARTDGPRDLRLERSLSLRLHYGLSYVPRAEGERLLRSMGRTPGKGLLGIVVSNATETPEIALLYATPQIVVDGWREAPVLARFRLRGQ